ncbi:2-amino-4-hydroxy-6-hydroxymethyldihydropteridine diphosphokinase, partial [Klebsiella pneumoniae]
MTLVYIALGSNLASPLEQVQAALRRPREIPQQH